MYAWLASPICVIYLSSASLDKDKFSTTHSVNIQARMARMELSEQYHVIYTFNQSDKSSYLYVSQPCEF